MEGAILTPNPTSWPSMLGNTPEFSSLLAGNELSTVRESLAIEAPDHSMLKTPQGPVTALMSLRQRFPFLPILPFPTEAVSLVLAANVAQNMQIPSGAALMCIRGNADFYCSLHGNAEVPAATNVSPGAENTTKSFYAPQGFLFYCGGVSQLSFVSPAAAIVTAIFFAPDQMPR